MKCQAIRQGARTDLHAIDNSRVYERACCYQRFEPQHRDDAELFGVCRSGDRPTRGAFVR